MGLAIGMLLCDLYFKKSGANHLGSHLTSDICSLTITLYHYSPLSSGSCVADLTWNTCGTACPRTCEDPNPASCSQVCTPRCDCPSSSPLLYNGACVTDTDCLAAGKLILTSKPYSVFITIRQQVLVVT